MRRPPSTTMDAADVRVLLVVCLCYDAALVAAGLVAAATGHVAGGVGVAVLGVLAALAGWISISVGSAYRSGAKRRHRRPHLRRRHGPVVDAAAGRPVVT